MAYFLKVLGLALIGLLTYVAHAIMLFVYDYFFTAKGINGSGFGVIATSFAGPFFLFLSSLISGVLVGKWNRLNIYWSSAYSLLLFLLVFSLLRVELYDERLVLALAKITYFIVPIVGAFVADTGNGVRVAVTGAGACVFRVPEMEKALSAKFAPDAIANVSVAADELNADMHASAEYRAHLVSVMAKRAVEKAVAG